MASPALPSAADLGLETDTALALYGMLTTAGARERRSTASQACRRRRDELETYAQAYAERNGVDLDVDRLALTDPVMIELLTLATA